MRTFYINNGGYFIIKCWIDTECFLNVGLSVPVNGITTYHDSKRLTPSFYTFTSDIADSVVDFIYNMTQEAMDYIDSEQYLNYVNTLLFGSNLSVEIENAFVGMIAHYWKCPKNVAEDDWRAISRDERDIIIHNLAFGDEDE